jgi:hypothetical protein
MKSSPARFAGPIAIVLICTAVCSAQAPATVSENPLVGAIDFHVHSGPDVFTRSVTDLEIARIARAAGMRALVLKNHFTVTADRAYLAEREVPGIRVFGGVSLNRAVGGINAEAVRFMTQLPGDHGKVVWLPTFDAENHVKHFKQDRPFVPVTEEGRVRDDVLEIFQLAAEHDLVIQTGHSSAEECLLLIRAARKVGVNRVVVTHAMADPIRMSIVQMKEAAALGAKLECVWASNLQGPASHLPSMRHWKQVTTADYARAIRAVGAEHFILSSDLGQYLNPLHTDGLKAFILGLTAEGITDADIDLMARKTPAWLLGLSESETVPSRP